MPYRWYRVKERFGVQWFLPRMLMFMKILFSYLWFGNTVLPWHRQLWTQPEHLRKCYLFFWFLLFYWQRTHSLGKLLFPMWWYNASWSSSIYSFWHIYSTVGGKQSGRDWTQRRGKVSYSLCAVLTQKVSRRFSIGNKSFSVTQDQAMFSSQDELGYVLSFNDCVFARSGLFYLTWILCRCLVKFEDRNWEDNSVPLVALNFHASQIFPWDSGLGDVLGLGIHFGFYCLNGIVKSSDSERPRNPNP